MRPMLRFAPALLAVILLSGCGYIPWFKGEKDPRPPTELTPITAGLGITTLWSSVTGKGTQGRRLSLAPAYQDGRVYVADAKGLVTAINAADGRQIWQRDTGLTLSGGPEVAGARLVAGSTNGELIALSATDGSELWRTRVGSEILSIPRIAGDLVVLHTLNDSVMGFDAASGEQRWFYDFQSPSLTLRGSSTPVISGDFAIVGVSGGRGLRGVAGRSGVIGGERGLVVLVGVPENDAEFLFQWAAADQAVEVEVTALVPAVAQGGAVGLVHEGTGDLSLHVVGLGDIDGDDTSGVTGAHVFLGQERIGGPVLQEAETQPWLTMRRVPVQRQTQAQQAIE